jgi:hypothetical protein
MHVTMAGCYLCNIILSVCGSEQTCNLRMCRNAAFYLTSSENRNTFQTESLRLSLNPGVSFAGGDGISCNVFTYCGSDPSFFCYQNGSDYVSLSGSCTLMFQVHLDPDNPESFNSSISLQSIYDQLSHGTNLGSGMLQLTYYFLPALPVETNWNSARQDQASRLNSFSLSDPQIMKRASDNLHPLGVSR